ncbi:hypothetical protein HGG76_05800 [Ochrobactrum tritici]|uniref:Uncharacterized protein n=1 Tax=Brucella tritici TaxID=94626 RepID=A0A7X6FPF1_9HYPH|nr:hypothetical protein [Brucella tritici]
MLEVVDSSLREVIHYPRRAFASAVISKQQRDAWLERMPQIRIYFANYQGKADLATFPGGRQETRQFRKPCVCEARRRCGHIWAACRYTLS